jgi:hypothetical protein
MKKGNIVGSRRKLTPIQKSVLIGTLLGDGTLELNGKYPRLRIQHSKSQLLYVEWKQNIFSNFTSKKIRISQRKKDSRTKKVYHYCGFDTFSIPLLNNFYELFYFSGKKIVPKRIDLLLTEPLSLAVWFMDDGYKRNDCNAIRISTESFSLKEQTILQKCLSKNFNVFSRIHKKGKFWNLYIPSGELNKFYFIISSYIIPSMNYKISLDPVTTDPEKER